MFDVNGMMFFLGFAAVVAHVFARLPRRPVPKAIPVRSELKGRYRSW